MSQFSANSDQQRPRTTKNIYFFKSGDNTFNGVKIPVNIRKHRNLDALLDDLNGRIPGLSHGVRQLRTPHGRHLVTNLNQLEHMGSYVCSERLNTQGAVPGVDFGKVKGLKGFQYNPTQQLPPSPTPSPPPPPEPEPKSPKKKIKKKKKKKKDDELAQSYNEEENESPDERSPRRRTESFRNYDDDGGEQEKSPKKVKQRSPKKEQRPKKDKSPENKKSSQQQQPKQTEPPKTLLINNNNHPNDEEENEDQLLDYEVYEEAEEIENVHSERLPPSRPSYSAPGTPSEARRLENLSPLDDKKLKHVQRRRISSKQINVDEYTLPNTRGSMRSANSVQDHEENEHTTTLQSKPPRSRPVSATSKKSAEILTIEHQNMESRNQTAKSRYDDDDNFDSRSRKMNADDEGSDYGEFDDGNARSKSPGVEEEHKGGERSKSRQSAKSANNKTISGQTTKQWGVEL